MNADKPDIFDRFMRLPVLRRFYTPYKKYKAILLYMLFGGLTTVVNLVFFDLFCSFGMSEPVANIPAWVLAVLFSYVTNRIWVFLSKVRGPALWGEILSFFGARGLTLLIEEALLVVFVTWLQFNGMVIKLLAMVVVIILNYVFSKLFVFKKK